MSSETLRYAAIMLLSGIGIPVLASLNAQLGNRIGPPASAATVLFEVAFLAVNHGPFIKRCINFLRFQNL